MGLLPLCNLTLFPSASIQSISPPLKKNLLTSSDCNSVNILFFFNFSPFHLSFCPAHCFDEIRSVPKGFQKIIQSRNFKCTKRISIKAVTKITAGRRSLGIDSRSENPSIPGIWISRMIRSGWRFRIAAKASIPLSYSPITSTSGSSLTFRRHVLARRVQHQ